MAIFRVGLIVVFAMMLDLATPTAMGSTTAPSPER
jgi:hypothetical protein